MGERDGVGGEEEVEGVSVEGEGECIVAEGRESLHGEREENGENELFWSKRKISLESSVWHEIS